MEARNSKPVNVSQLLVSALERASVRFVFGYPGDENLPFLDAVRASSQMDFVLTRHESGAGFMAAAHGYQTGDLAVVMSTLGAGATNLTTSVAHAYLAELPMIAITGQKPVLDNTQGRYQIVDVVDVMRPITKFTASVPSAEALPGLIAEAVHQALEYPQGPVHLELPVDIAALDASGVELLPSTTSPRPGPAPAAIEAVVDRLREAKRPVVLIGSAANLRWDLTEPLRRFLDATQLPFVATMMGKGVGDETSPNFVGTSAMPERGFPKCAFAHADLILSVGHNVMEKAPFTMTKDGPDVIHIHENAATADTIWFPSLQLLGDMGLSFDALTEALTPLPDWDLDGFVKLGQGMREAIAPNPGLPTGVPIKPQLVVPAIREALEPTDIVSLDNGIHKLWLTRNYIASEPRTVMVDSALGAMGPGIPAAIATKLVYPDRRVVAVIGDGGMLMTGQELETAVRLDIDLTVLVFNDSGLGMIRLKQKMDGYETHGVDFANPDIIGFAQAFGAHGHRLTDALDLPGLLEESHSRGGVHLIDIPIDYGENGPLMKSLKMLDCHSVLSS